RRPIRQVADLAETHHARAVAIDIRLEFLPIAAVAPLGAGPTAMITPPPYRAVVLDADTQHLVVLVCLASAVRTSRTFRVVAARIVARQFDAVCAEKFLRGHGVRHGKPH